MNIIDVHPDDLLDREIEGTLSVEGRRRLRAHLERCTQCRLERQLRSDFEEELGADEDAKSIQSFVSGALQAARAPSAPRVARKSVSHTWRRRLVFLVAATMVFATGLAAAQVEIADRAFTAAREKIAFVFRSKDLERPSSVATISAKTPASPEPTPAAAAEETNLAPPVVEVVERASSRPVSFGARRTLPSEANVVSAQAEQVAMPVPSSEAAERPRDSASAIFDGASAARRRGNWVEAAELYRDLQVRFPMSAEARLSIAVVARMQLDLGETGAAASGFASYLATGDHALREEAMAGRAIALGRLGRAREEVEAWRELLLAYPSSGYAGLARTRLRQDSP